jgi:hypothetical protein
MGEGALLYVRSGWRMDAGATQPATETGVLIASVIIFSIIGTSATCFGIQ